MCVELGGDAFKHLQGRRTGEGADWFCLALRDRAGFGDKRGLCGLAAMLPTPGLPTLALVGKVLSNC